MTVSPQTISLSAAALLLVGTPLALWLGGAAFGAGFAASGGLMLVNLALWVCVVKKAIESVLSGNGGGLALVLYFTKFLALIGLLVFLLTRFPPLSVVLGSSVVVAAVMAVAAVGLGTGGLQVSEGSA